METAELFTWIITLFLAGVALALTLAGTAAGAFFHLLKRFDAARAEANERLEAARAETNERLEAARAETNEQFGRVHERLEAARAETNEQFGRVHERLEAMRAETNERLEAMRTEANERFGRVHERFDHMEEKADKTDDKIENVASRTGVLEEAVKGVRESVSHILGFIFRGRHADTSDREVEEGGRRERASRPSDPPL